MLTQDGNATTVDSSVMTFKRVRRGRGVESFSGDAGVSGQLVPSLMDAEAQALAESSNAVEEESEVGCEGRP